MTDHENRTPGPNDSSEAFAAVWRNGDRHEHNGERFEPDLRDLLVRGLSRSRKWVVAMIALGAAAGILAGRIQPDTFVSDAKLLLRVGAREQVTAESLSGLEEGQRTAPPTMLDELQMLSDVGVFERVAAKIGPREILQPADPRRNDGPDTSLRDRFLHGIQALCLRFSTSSHECATEDCAECMRDATKLLIEETDVHNELGSNVILVSHTSTSPERARDIAQALVAAFIERHRDQFSVQSVVDKNRDKVEEAKRARDAADELYIQALNEVGFTDLDTQGPELQLEISDLEKELFTARMRREEIASQRGALSERLKGIPAKPTESQQPAEIVLPPEMVLNEEYETQLALKRSLLAQKYSVPLEIRPREEIRLRERELDELIAKVDQKLAQIPKTIAGSPKTITRAPVAAAQTRERREVLLALRLDDLDFEDQALAVRVEHLADRLAERRAHQEEARKLGLVAALRRKDLASARDLEESRYKHLLERFSALESLESIDLEDDANLSVLQMPTLDPEKVGPKRLALFLKGLIAGVLAGAAFAVLRQRFDRTLSYPEAFERASGVPVLAVVPDVGSLRTPYATRATVRAPRVLGRWN